ncbi:hypothetical protein L218DRAFT_966651 [Marasmius fiardii PR-910]|nr:hypothetical protein L218DRAFT_966651 [Marasmius fiardii PR-910]
MAAAAVSGSHLVSFVEGSNKQSRQDVLNSLLFAELTAEKQVNKQTDKNNWIHAYCDALVTLGWTFQSWPDIYYVVKDSYKYGSVDALVNESMKVVLESGSEAELSKSAVKALQGSGSAVGVFNKKSQESNRANFRLGVVTQDHSTIKVQLGFFYYENDANITDTLFTKFKNDNVSCYEVFEIAELNTQDYAKIRDSVIQRLGKNASELVKSVDI